MDNERDALNRQPDWHITTILSDDTFIEVDSNSGAKRTIRESKCSCGRRMLIEHNARTCRTDGKRIFFADKPDSMNGCLFRCDCGAVVSSSVPGAEHGLQPSEGMVRNWWKAPLRPVAAKPAEDLSPSDLEDDLLPALIDRIREKPEEAVDLLIAVRDVAYGMGYGDGRRDAAAEMKGKAAN